MRQTGPGGGEVIGRDAFPTPERRHLARENTAIRRSDPTACKVAAKPHCQFSSLRGVEFCHSGAE
jgi:hypothetical protein